MQCLQCGNQAAFRPQPFTGHSLHLSVFISAFLAATIFPAQSEAILAYQLSQSQNAVVSLVAVATAGNVLGALVNWGLGRFFARYRDLSLIHI